ncbi:elongator complex protein 5 [Clupea harengus]|uniref:Elongator complex protein 5 n=1 Tax=Clupea harengus TaxID=7950 RepID=A0A6P3VP39_CLUHA|nr:elongator complex protein 5 [Clupea harengus]
MLLDVLQGAEAGTFIIFLDSVNFSGRSLLKGYINAALKREDVVHVLELEVSEEELRAGLDTQCARRMYFHGGFADPLGWIKRSSFTVPQFTSEDILTLLTPVQQSKSAVLVIDSLSWLLRHLDPVVICKRLQEIKRGGAVKTIIGLLHSDMHQTSLVGSVCHLATTVISLGPRTQGQWALAKTTKRTKSGKVLQEEELFSIQEDLTVHSRVSHTVHTQAEPDSVEADPMANLTFNLRLSEMEREAKEKVALPFVFSQEKKSALLHPGQGAGQIMYEPDANDDFDQEDPDEDLDV